jgi:hypothetical protein
MPEDAELLELSRVSEAQPGSCQGLPEIRAEEPVLSGMEEDVPGDKVLVKSRIKLFKKIYPARL